MSRESLSEKGLFGEFGGCYVPPQLNPALDLLEEKFISNIHKPEFQQALDYQFQQFVGRPNPLYFAKKLTEQLGGAKIYLKREDLNHTGSHKINNAIGQVLLAKQIGHKRVIAETGAGQHGVATATAAALFDLDCTIYMGEEDMKRQALNVFRMELLGAEVVPVKKGAKTLKEAVDEALDDLANNYNNTYYMLGSAVGPHPYPTIVKYFQSIIGREAREQILAQEGKLPDYITACVGGGSNSIGLFAPFVEDKAVKIVGVEPGGLGLDTGKHAAAICKGKPALIHGFKCHVLTDEQGNPASTHSIAAGLDYPGVGPEHSYLKASKRADYVAIKDQEALDAFMFLSKTEGIIPALESSHAVAYACKLAPTLTKDQIIIVCLSGRGDKDVAQIYDMLKKKEQQ